MVDSKTLHISFSPKPKTNRHCSAWQLLGHASRRQFLRPRLLQPLHGCNTAFLAVNNDLPEMSLTTTTEIMRVEIQNSRSTPPWSTSTGQKLSMEL